MKTPITHLALALLAGTVATAREPRGNTGHQPPPVPPLLAIFDEDRDGVLSAEEIENAAEALGNLDRNNDGEISIEEMRPPRPDEGEHQAPPAEKMVPPVIAALDTDRDGSLSAEELDAAPESLLVLDVDGDGEISSEELHPHGPPPEDPTEEPTEDD